MILFPITLVVSALLLFSIQLMFAKMILPLLGGTPAVWNTCMVFFQAALLAGYSYAHVTTTCLRPRKQLLLHLGLMAAAVLSLPIHLPHGWIPPTMSNPIPALLRVMLVTLGIPFFVVSASAPLLQQWFTYTRSPSARDPYFLYAASNCGSFLGLLGYPTVIEPWLTLKDQRLAWTIGYGILMGLTALCAAFVWRLIPQESNGNSPNEPSASGLQEITFEQRLRWILLSFVPSSMMLGTTTYLSTDIAAIPLLWVIPLATYLLTFILVFAKRPPINHAFMVRSMPFIVLGMSVIMVTGRTSPGWFLILTHVILLFVCSMVCHGELAKSRPAAEHLTQFYLWLSVGGVLGGLFNALIAPVIFDLVLEYPLAIVLACLLRPGSPSQTAHPVLQGRFFDYSLPLVLGLLVKYLHTFIPENWSDAPVELQLILIYLPTALACYLFRYRPVRFALGVGALLFVGIFSRPDWTNLLHIERSFFGVYRVKIIVDSERSRYHELLHGTTLHGMQSMSTSRRHEPLTYYDPTGPLGDIFQSFATSEAPRLRRIAVIGLGTGSTSCYASPGQDWTFYEIDPTVQRLATTPQYFTFLQNCLERYQVVLGDARLSFERAPDRAYNLVVIDAFSSDAIPVHLMTREALQLYLRKLADGGLLAFHISNRHLNLEPILGNLAQTEHLEARARSDFHLTLTERDRGKSPSHWVVLARSPYDLSFFQQVAKSWYPVLSKPQARVWRDDYSNLLSAFRWKQ